jgi:hypothetical protein
MIEQSRNEKKMLAIERAKFRLKQRIEQIDWEYDYLKPQMAEFKGRAQLPELPSETIVEIEFDPGTDRPEAV